jgi:putative oxidoreductase
MQSTESSRSKLFFPVMQPVYDGLSPYVYTALRVMAGLFLIPHGAGKLFSLWNHSLEATTGFFAKLGLEPAFPLAVLVGATEFFGGILIAIGLFTRPVAAMAAVLLFVAAFKVHWEHGFFWNVRGIEYAVFWGVVCILIVIRGGGPHSVDARIGREF